MALDRCQDTAAGNPTEAEIYGLLAVQDDN